MMHDPFRRIYRCSVSASWRLAGVVRYIEFKLLHASMPESIELGAPLDKRVSGFASIKQTITSDLKPEEIAPQPSLLHITPQKAPAKKVLDKR